MSEINIKKLEEILGTGAVKINEPMSAHTTFRIGGPADAYAEASSSSELLSVLNYLTEEKIPFEIIGNGSNLLVSDAGFRGVIISVKPWGANPSEKDADGGTKYKTEELPDGSLRATVSAGCLLSTF